MEQSERPQRSMESSAEQLIPKLKDYVMLIERETSPMHSDEVDGKNTHFPHMPHTESHISRCSGGPG